MNPKLPLDVLRKLNGVGGECSRLENEVAIAAAGVLGEWRRVCAAASPRELSTILKRFSGYSGDALKFRYSEADLFIDEVWGGPLLVPNMGRGVDPGRDSFGYGPTPVSLVVEAVDRLELGSQDLFVDIGCGRGRVLALVGKLTDARLMGIDRSRHMIQQCSALLRSLRLSERCILQNQEVETASFAGGTVFFMFNPFRGAPLESSLAAIREEGRVRPVRLVAVGDVVRHLYEQCSDWLTLLWGDRLRTVAETEGAHCFLVTNGAM
jgi:SAM-dependent methyltransferase